MRMLTAAFAAVMMLCARPAAADPPLAGTVVYWRGIGCYALADVPAGRDIVVAVLNRLGERVRVIDLIEALAASDTTCRVGSGVAVYHGIVEGAEFERDGETFDVTRRRLGGRDIYSWLARSTGPPVRSRYVPERDA